jgi:uncharacterized protein YndB with AHSA1/START domain
MSQDVASILGQYDFKSLRPGENDSTVIIDGGGVFVVACEHESVEPGEIRFSLLWADRSDQLLQAAKAALQQDWSQYCSGYRFLLLAKVDDPRERSQVVLDLRAHCKKGRK